MKVSFVKLYKCHGVTNSDIRCKCNAHFLYGSQLTFCTSRLPKPDHLERNKPVSKPHAIILAWECKKNGGFN